VSETVGDGDGEAETVDVGDCEAPVEKVDVVDADGSTVASAEWDRE